MNFRGLGHYLYNTGLALPNFTHQVIFALFHLVSCMFFLCELFKHHFRDRI